MADMNPSVLRPLGPTHPGLPFVRVRTAGSGQPAGSLTVFAVHATDGRRVPSRPAESARRAGI